MYSLWIQKDIILSKNCYWILLKAFLYTNNIYHFISLILRQLIFSLKKLKKSLCCCLFQINGLTRNKRIINYFKSFFFVAWLEQLEFDPGVRIQSGFRDLRICEGGGGCYFFHKLWQIRIYYKKETPPLW